MSQRLGARWAGVFAAIAGMLPQVVLGTVDQTAREAEPATFYSTATVRERALSSATGSVTVIDRRTIEDSGARTLADVLAFVPGVTVTTNATRGGLSVAQIRGGDPNFTLVLIDGVVVNDGTYQVGGVFNLESLPTAAIERVEVVRGPLSAFYGSAGLAGAIHIVTRSAGHEGGFDGAVGLSAGDASHAGQSAQLGWVGDRADAFLSASREAESGRIAEEASELWNLQGRLGLDLGAGSRARVTLRLASLESDDYPEASGGPVYGSGELRRGDNEEISLGGKIELGDPAGVAHKVSLGFYRHDLDRTSPAIIPLVPESNESTRYTRARAGWASTVDRSSPAGGREARRWRLSAGADVEREKGENDSVLLLPPFLDGAVAGDYSLTRTNPGVFAEALYEQGDWAVELGARVDAPDTASTQLSPRFGVSFRPGGGATRWRASAGRAFKLPSFFALASPPALGGNPDLRPETSIGADLGVERRFDEARATVTLNLFLSRFEELVDFDFATFSHVNRSEVGARGAEAAVAWRPAEGLALAANVTWQDVEDRLTGEPLRQRPEWSGALRLDWRPRPELRLHLDGRALSSAADEQIPVPQRRSIAGRTLWGAGGSWELVPRLRLEVRLDNLLDESYETMIGFPGAGRSARLGLRWGSETG